MIEKNVKFGPSSFEWVNPALKVIHDKLSQYYKNDKLICPPKISKNPPAIFLTLCILNSETRLVI